MPSEAKDLCCRCSRSRNIWCEKRENRLAEIPQSIESGLTTGVPACRTESVLDLANMAFLGGREEGDSILGGLLASDCGSDG